MQFSSRPRPSTFGILSLTALVLPLQVFHFVKFEIPGSSSENTTTFFAIDKD